MRKLLFILLLLFNVNIAFAQSDNKGESKNVESFLVNLEIPRNYHLKDKMILRNKSNYVFGMISVAVNDNGKYYPIGSCMDVVPGEDHEIVSYKNNELKSLRGKTIAIKVKGFKAITGFKENQITNVDPNEFNIRVSAERHDLIIEIFSSLF